jgi:hypothetical protein
MGVLFSEDWLAAQRARASAGFPASPAPRADTSATLHRIHPADAKPRRRRTYPEADLQIAGIQLLEAALPPSWRVFHVPNAGKRGKAEAGQMAAMGLRAGFPDLGIIGPPADGSRFARLVVAEAKAGRGQLTEAQEEWRDWFLSIGIAWFVFRSIEDLVAGLVDAGVPLRLVGGVR